MLFSYTYSEDDVLVTKMFNDFWGNFAYTGKPTDDLSLWPYYTEQDSVNKCLFLNVNKFAPREGFKWPALYFLILVFCILNGNSLIGLPNILFWAGN